jgi:FkbM family methyltransferase
MKKTLKKIFGLLPKNIKRTIVDVWRSIYPAKIWINQINGKKCLFEARTSREIYRIASLGDEEEFIKRVMQSLSQEDIFFDIGACLGLYSVHAASQGARVISFEPDPIIRRRLARNINLNSFVNTVQVVEWAVSNKPGTLRLYTDGVKGRHSPSLNLGMQHDSLLVKTNSIDNALESGEIPYPTKLKMDIEGAEVLALEGMSRLLKSVRAPREIFLEIHPVLLKEFGSSEEECRRLLVDHDYVESAYTVRQQQIHAVYEKGG